MNITSRSNIKEFIEMLKMSEEIKEQQIKENINGDSDYSKLAYRFDKNPVIIFEYIKDLIPDLTIGNISHTCQYINDQLDFKLNKDKKSVEILIYDHRGKSTWKLFNLNNPKELYINESIIIGSFVYKLKPHIKEVFKILNKKNTIDEDEINFNFLFLINISKIRQLCNDDDFNTVIMEYRNLLIHPEQLHIKQDNKYSRCDTNKKEYMNLCDDKLPNNHILLNLDEWIYQNQQTCKKVSLNDFITAIEVIRDIILPILYLRKE